MIRPISITAVANGWTVAVGCQTLVFTDVTALATELVAYLRDPDAVEKRYLENAINIKHTNGGNVIHTECPTAPAPPAQWTREADQASCGVAGNSAGLRIEPHDLRYLSDEVARNRVVPGTTHYR